MHRLAEGGEEKKISRLPREKGRDKIFANFCDNKTLYPVGQVGGAETILKMPSRVEAKPDFWRETKLERNNENSAKIVNFS